ncbi:MAG: hypothetical protein KAQ68_08885 [Clostridiales bacterium]|nr:hypothetical protein [Clostridiales bacterium]
MNTKKQEELVNSFLSMLDDEIRPLYQDIIMHLSDLGYNPQKQRSNIIFKHDQHNKQISKIGFRRNKEHLPFFALRFSACRGYSKRFTDIISAAIVKYPTRVARCIDDDCAYCAGEADTHVYTYIPSDGKVKYHCGASALEIPYITADDIEEIKKLIKEEHVYLMKHQAGIII